MRADKYYAPVNTFSGGSYTSGLIDGGVKQY